MAEKLRAFLGHDMGIRGPEDLDVVIQDASGGPQWNMPLHMQSMAA